MYGIEAEGILELRKAIDMKIQSKIFPAKLQH